MTTNLKDKLNAVIDEIVQEGVAQKLNDLLSSLHVPGTPKRVVARAAPKGKKSISSKKPAPGVPSTKQCLVEFFNENRQKWVDKTAAKKYCAERGVNLTDTYFWNITSDWNKDHWIERGSKVGKDGFYRSIKALPNASMSK